MSHETFERHPISTLEALLEQYKHTNAKASNEPSSRLPVIGCILNTSQNEAKIWTIRKMSSILWTEITHTVTTLDNHKHPI